MDYGNCPKRTRSHTGTTLLLPSNGLKTPCSRLKRADANVSIDIRQGTRNKPISAHIIEAAETLGWTYYTQIIWNKWIAAGLTAWGSWKSATDPYIVCPVETISC